MLTLPWHSWHFRRLHCREICKDLNFSRTWAWQFNKWSIVSDLPSRIILEVETETSASFVNHLAEYKGDLQKLRTTIFHAEAFSTICVNCCNEPQHWVLNWLIFRAHVSFGLPLFNAGSRKWKCSSANNIRCNTEFRGALAMFKMSITLYSPSLS